MKVSADDMLFKLSLFYIYFIVTYTLLKNFTFYMILNKWYSNLHCVCFSIMPYYIYVRTYMPARMHIHTHIYIHAYIRSYIRVRTRTHVCMFCTYIRKHTYIHTCIHTYIHTYIHGTCHSQQISLFVQCKLTPECWSARVCLPKAAS